MKGKKKKISARPITASFISLGCFKNLVDTEVLGGLLENRGIEIVSAYEAADWLIINSCGFIRDAKEESIDEVLAALEKKERGETRHVAVFGCLTQRYLAGLRKSFANVDVLWGVNDIEELADRIAGRTTSAYADREPFLYTHRHRRILTTTPNSTFIKISEGCDMSCSFCAIPKIRGPYRSRPLPSIIKEAEHYRDMGFSEISLISQNSTHYGHDLGNGALLPELLNEISKIGFSWVRVLYLMPEQTTEAVIEAFSRPAIVPYFDLPFQHVAPTVLKNMNRGGGVQKDLELIQMVRQHIPDAVIRSSFIAGFPGESEDDFSMLARFIQEARIEYVGVFAYSDEEGTPAFLLKRKNTPGVVEGRKTRLQEVADQNLRAYFNSLKGTVQEFLPLGPWTNESTIGRIRSQAPEVDGLTEIKEKFIGQYQVFPVQITGFHFEVLEGKRGIVSKRPSAVAIRQKKV